MVLGKPFSLSSVRLNRKTTMVEVVQVVVIVWIGDTPHDVVELCGDVTGGGGVLFAYAPHVELTTQSEKIKESAREREKEKERERKR